MSRVVPAWLWLWLYLWLQLRLAAAWLQHKNFTVDDSFSCWYWLIPWRGQDAAMRTSSGKDIKNRQKETTVERLRDEANDESDSGYDSDAYCAGKRQLFWHWSQWCCCTLRHCERLWWMNGGSGSTREVVEKPHRFKFISTAPFRL